MSEIGSGGQREDRPEKAASGGRRVKMFLPARLQDESMIRRRLPHRSVMKSIEQHQRGKGLRGEARKKKKVWRGNLGLGLTPSKGGELLASGGRAS